MPILKSQIESLLFISNKPFTVAKLAELAGAGKDETGEALKALEEEYNKKENGGVRVVRHNNQIQMVTGPENAKIVQDFLKDEMTGELTNPSTEALTIIAYRGPIAKSELEQIRGVNCSLILRNLMIKGLVETSEDKNVGTIFYNVTLDFLRHLGINSVKELPDYEKLSQADIINKILNLTESADAEAAEKQPGEPEIEKIPSVETSAAPAEATEKQEIEETVKNEIKK